MNSLFTTTAYAILELFIQYPTKNYSVREIARAINKSHATVIPHIKSLHELGFISQNTQTLYPTYHASDSSELRLYKTTWIKHKILSSKLIEEIKKHYPSTIILFGSCAKGTFTQDSDIDLFVQAKPMKLSLTPYEEYLGKKINLLFESNPENLTQELRNNIINGVLLYGYLRLDELQDLPRTRNTTKSPS